MKRLRLVSALFFCWLFVLYNVERIHEPVQIASFVYALAALMAVPILLVPRLTRLSMLAALIPAAALVLVVKYSLGYALIGVALPVTVTEIMVTLITVGLGLLLGRALTEYQDAVVTAIVGHLSKETQPYERGLEEMYREVRRARAFKRPFTLLTVSPTVESVNVSLDRLTKEMHQETVGQFVNAKLGQVLTNGTKQSDIIVRMKDHFVMLLPETSRHKASRLVRKIRNMARTELGLDVAIGASAFPEDEVTFVKLLERAQARMDRGSVADLVSVARPGESQPDGAAAGPRPASASGTKGDEAVVTELVPAHQYRRPS